MAEDALKRQLRDLLAKVADEEVTVDFEDNLFQLGVLDSVLLIHFVSELEKTFSIAVTDREMIPDYFLSIQRVSLYVRQKLAQSGTAATEQS
jgi:acyl carrier protein